MISRLNLLIKKLNLSQNKFSKQIGFTQGNLSRILSGQREINERTIQLICLKFNVNETWLRTGEGEIFNSQPDHLRRSDQEIAEKYLIEKIQKLPTDLQEDVFRFCDRLLATKNNNNKKTEDDNDDFKDDF